MSEPEKTSEERIEELRERIRIGELALARVQSENAAVFERWRGTSLALLDKLVTYQDEDEPAPFLVRHFWRYQRRRIARRLFQRCVIFIEKPGGLPPELHERALRECGRIRDRAAKLMG